MTRNSRQFRTVSRIISSIRCSRTRTARILSNVFARFGANANAYTSTNMTAYLFSCTSCFKENLEILLDFVTTPYFTSETVEKEHGIIAQEIRMYDDHPFRSMYQTLLESLYEKHNVRINVAGTVESISHITADILYECYRVFYNLSNMMLIVCGDVTVDEVNEVCDKILKKQAPVDIIRDYPSRRRRCTSLTPRRRCRSQSRSSASESRISTFRPTVTSA